MKQMTRILGTESVNDKTKSYDGRLFKNVLEFGRRGEAQKIQLQVVDGNGSVMAETKSVFSVEEAVNLLKKLLLLPLSPQAPPWLKNRLH